MTQSMDWLSLLALAGTLAVMVFLLRRSMKGMKQQDWILLRQVRARGIDLRVPQPVDFLLFAATEESATELADQMRVQGFQSSIKQAQMQYARSKAKPGKSQDGWLVTGKRTLVIEPQALTDTRKLLTAISSEKRAVYLGWQLAASRTEPADTTLA